MRHWTILAAILSVAAVVALLPPSQRPALATDLCPDTGSSAGPFNIEAYEALDSGRSDGRQTYMRTMELASHNRLFPDVPSFAPASMETGPRGSGSSSLRAPYVPPTLLKAIAWIESTMVQADWSVPWGAVGPVLISHDCGYGIMQVTTGMQNTTGVPALEQAMIGGHYAFNIARGMQILIDKWNYAPEARPIVGDRDPGIIEDFYYAVWGYNGFAFSNHPANYDPLRGEYSCGPSGDGFGHDRSRYPYQELVFGCMEHPPSRSGAPLWAPQPVSLPNPFDPAFAGLNPANWSACAADLNCAAMDIPTPQPTHADPTGAPADRSQVLGVPQAAVSPASVALLANLNGQSEVITASISNAGSGLLAWRLSSSAPWLKISRVQGVSLGADIGPRAATFTFYADAVGLFNGTHQGTITVESLYAPGGSAKIDVVLQVAGDFAVSTFQPWPGYNMGSSWLSGDFNGDGRSDLLQLTNSDYVHPWLSNGVGGFSVGFFRPWPGYNIQNGTWLSGDYNGDGRTDLIQLTDSDYAHPWLSNGDGTFSVGYFRPWAGYNVRAGFWLTADLDGDARTDLIHFAGPDYVHPWLSNGVGGFSVGYFRPWAGYNIHTGNWRTGDFNGDGRTDLVQLTTTDYAQPWLSNGAGGFDVGFFRPWLGYNMQSGIWLTGDFNGDGRTDLIQVTPDEYAHPWLSAGNGAFSVLFFQPWRGYNTRFGSWLTGDFNGDGKTDILHTCCPEVAHSWQSRGDGAFEISIFRPWPGYNLQVGRWSTGDLNGDRKTDLVHFCCNGYVNIWLARR